VLELIQEVKKDAEAYYTNFYSMQEKVQTWIDHGELSAGRVGASVLLLRKDRGFSHLYFGARNVAALEQSLRSWSTTSREAIVVDLLGREPELFKSLESWESCGFKRYTQLNRMTRTAHSQVPMHNGSDSRIAFAEPADCEALLKLLGASFDPFSEQLPTVYEIEAAVNSRQILVARHQGTIAGMLFFETQGLSSTLRYWLVAHPFRAHGFGSALLRAYLGSQQKVSRYLLWVIAHNKSAIEKYTHYGYAPDGLIDYVLANANLPYDALN